MKYTASKDGNPRATIRIPVRLTREEIQTAKRMAAERETDWRYMLTSLAEMIIEHEIEEWDDPQEHPLENVEL